MHDIAGIKGVSMQHKICSGFIKAIDEEKRIITHFISVEGADRDKEILLIDGVKLDNYKSKPDAGIVLWLHGHDSNIRGFVPIAKNQSIGQGTYIDKQGKTYKGLEVATKFYDDEFSQTIFKMYKGNFLTDWSVGFIPMTDRLSREDGTYTFEKWELLEYSAVPVGANQFAKAVEKGIISADELDLFNEKGVIPYKKTPLAPEGEAWDGPGEMAKAEVSDLKVMCTWYDGENPDIKGSYKLPHHKADGHACVWRGVANAMARLSQTNIPDSDRNGCFNHLAKHYADFGKEPPEKSLILEPESINQIRLIRTEEIIRSETDRRFKDLENRINQLETSIKNFVIKGDNDGGEFIKEMAKATRR